jgi:hypothetical protein
LFFKYTDANGKVTNFFYVNVKKFKVYISAKSKGAVFLTDTPFGAFLSSTLAVLNTKQFNIDKLPPALEALAQKDVQSITFELCGSKGKFCV